MKTFQLLGDPKKFWWSTSYTVLFGKQVLRACSCSSNWGMALDATGNAMSVSCSQWRPIPMNLVFHLPLLLAFSPLPYLPLSCLFPLSCSPVPFPPQGGRKGWSTGWASSSSNCLGACYLCATLLCLVLRQVVLDGMGFSLARYLSLLLEEGRLGRRAGQLCRAQLSEKLWEQEWEEGHFLSAAGEVSIQHRENQVVEMVRRLYHDTWTSVSWGRFQLCAEIC